MAALAEAFVRIRPDTRGFRRDAERGILGSGKELGESLGDAFAKAFARRAKQQTRDLPLGPPRQRARKAGEESAGSFADGFRKRLQAAVKALPPLDIGPARNAAAQQVRDLAAALRHLSGKRVGVDIASDAALAELRRLHLELDDLSRSSPDIQVRADAAAASAQLTKVAQQARAVGDLDPTIRVHANTASASAGLSAVGAAAGVSVGGVQSLLAVAAAIAPVIVPAAAAATAALAAIGPAAVLGAAGVGVLALGFAGVGDAVKAMGEAQQQAGKDAAQAAVRQLSLASAADAVTSAQRTLANTRIEVAEANAQAVQRVADAERDLTHAQDDARAIQDDLTRARQEAREALEDLDSQAKSNALAQRQGNLDVAEAKRALDKVLADPKATKAQVEQARIRYEREVLQQEDLRRRGKRLVDEQKAAVKAGIDGSDQVRAVRDRQAKADERVAAAERALAAARRGQASQERQGALQIVQAQQAVIAAQRQLRSASISAGAAGSSAMNKLREAMDNLSPAGRRFAKFLFGLRPVLDRLKAAAQSGLLPGVEAGIRALLPVLPQVEVFVGRVAKALGGFFAAMGRGLASPFWARFFDDLGRLAGPLLQSLGRILDGFARGFGSLLLAFAPLTVKFADGLAGIAQGFAAWAAELPRTQGFKDFIAYVQRNGPKLLEVMGRFAVLALRLLVLLAPLGELILTGLVKGLELLTEIDTRWFTVIVYAVGALVTVLTALAGGPISAVVAGLVLVVGAIVSAYKEFDGFRRVVDTSARAVAAAAVWLWRQVLVPAFEGIAAAVTFAWTKIIQPVFAAIEFWITRVVGPVFLWLWRNVVKPVWAGISLAIQVAWAVIKVIFGLIQIYVKAVLAPVFIALWKTIIEPVFKGIGATIKFTWENVIRPVFKALGGFVKAYVVPAFKAGVDAVGKAWNAIRDLAKGPVEFVVNTVLNKGLLAGYNKLADLFDVTPKNVQIPWPPAGFARGGILPGYTPGRDVHRFVSPTGGVLDLSGGEPILRPEAGRVLGRSWVDGVNAAARTGGIGGVRRFLGGYAGGGLLDNLGAVYDRARKTAGDAITGAKNLITDPGGALRALADRLLGLVPGHHSPFGQIIAGGPRRVVSAIVSNLVGHTRTLRRLDGGGPGNGASPFGGSAGMMRALRAVFPGLRLISGFRPGSRTLSGNRSYHAADRAVDLPPSRPVAEYINRTFRGVTKELITPFQEFNLLNGRPHRYTGAIWRQHNFAGGNAHDHWAARLGGVVGSLPRVPVFDDGGTLAPGYNLVNNRTGGPEELRPTGRGGGDVHIHLHNHGVIGSEQQLENWLVRSVDRARRKGRIT